MSMRCLFTQLSLGALVLGMLGGPEVQAQSATQQPETQAEAEARLPDAPSPQNNETPKPVGTAAAEPLKVTGVAASKPAGVALAPRKQPRIRSILIKVGVVVGAGAAVGTVLALSKASPSRPPGAD